MTRSRAGLSHRPPPPIRSRALNYNVIRQCQNENSRLRNKLNGNAVQIGELSTTIRDLINMHDKCRVEKTTIINRLNDKTQEYVKDIQKKNAVINELKRQIRNNAKTSSEASSSETSSKRNSSRNSSIIPNNTNNVNARINLMQWYHDHISKKPNNVERKALAKTLAITNRDVQDWFDNKWNKSTKAFNA